MCVEYAVSGTPRQQTRYYSGKALPSEQCQTIKGRYIFATSNHWIVMMMVVMMIAVESLLGQPDLQPGCDWLDRPIIKVSEYLLSTRVWRDYVIRIT